MIEMQLIFAGDIVKHQLEHQLAWFFTLVTVGSQISLANIDYYSLKGQDVHYWNIIKIIMYDVFQ